MEIPSLERQREIIDIVFNRGLNEGDLSVADKYLTENYESHGSYDDSIKGPASFKLTIEMQRRSFSDITYEVKDVVSQGDKSALHWVMRGRHTGPFVGIPATGKEVEHQAMLILRFEGDQIAERWGVVDNFTLMRKLQGISGPLAGPPGQRPGAGKATAGGPRPGAAALAALKAAESNG
jgi:predicted ester cyclase